MNPTRLLLSISTGITPFTRRLFQLPPPLPQPSSSHTTLTSFLTHAARTSLPESSTLYQGTHYEYTIQSALRALGFSLSRCGGRSDLGVDLTGTWHVGDNPITDPPVRVVVQCKALKTKIGPNIVRELEGVTGRHSSKATRGRGVAGVLVSPREATRGVREALGRSGMPLVWMMVERGGRVRQVLWNGVVEGMGLGLGGLGVEAVYNSHSGSDSGGDGKEVRLTWEGREVQSIDEIEEGMRRLEEEWMEKWKERGLGDVSGEEILDAVERVVPGTRPIMITDAERDMVVKSLLST